MRVGQKLAIGFFATALLAAVVTIVYNSWEYVMVEVFFGVAAIASYLFDIKKVNEQKAKE